MGPETTPYLEANASTASGPGAHNVSVDEVRRGFGACAQVHLPTGRTCTNRHGHQDSCEFVAPDQVDASIARHRAAEGW